MKNIIAVIDDEKPIRDTLKGVLEDEGFVVLTAPDGPSGIRLVRENIPDVVMLDIWMPEMDGITVLEKIKEEFPQLPVIIMSGHGTVETAVKATKMGAFDFVEKPLSLDRLILLINNTINYFKLLNENLYLKEKYFKNADFVGVSPVIKKVFDDAQSIAKTAKNVIILGEEGTGKSFLARFIHTHCDRNKNNYVELKCILPINCTIDIVQDKISLARNGTLYIEEFTHLSHDAQKLLINYKDELKLILSTSMNFKEELEKGHVLSAFFYSIDGVVLAVPPLRDRKEDIIPLVQHFRKALSQQYSKDIRFSDQVLEILGKYTWNGNIKEIKNFVEHMLITSKGNVITHKDIPDYIVKDMNVSYLEDELFRHNLLIQAKKAFEKEFIRQKLLESSGNTKKTAEILGIQKIHLEKKIIFYGLKGFVK